MRYLGGHLGHAVSALLDGQLDAGSTERAWGHVHVCDACRRQVEHEGWVKTRLASMSTGDAPAPARLLGSLYDLPGTAGPVHREDHAEDAAAAWAAVAHLERQDSARRRTSILVLGAGSLSAAVLGVLSVAGGPFGGAPAVQTPSAVLTRPAAPAGGTATLGPVARARGDLGAAPASALPTATGSASPTADEGASRLLH